jgi:hypothetical protein
MRYLCLTTLMAFGLVSSALGSPDILLPAGVVVAPGEQTLFPVTLATPAPDGGVFITLSSSDTSKLTISPAAFFIPQGATSYGRVQVTGISVGTASVSAVAANLVGGTQTVQVGSSAPLTLSFSPQSITILQGASQNVNLTLSSAAPAGGLTVSLTADNPGVAQVQPSVGLFPDGSSQATVKIPIGGVGPGTTIIHASTPGIPAVTLSVTVSGPGAITLPAGITLSPGQSAAFLVTLSTPAPSGGVTVALGSSDSSKVTISPASIFIAGGATTAATQPQVTGVNIGSALISASATGYTPASQSVQVQQVQGGTLSFSPNSLTIPGVGTRMLQLNISPAAPAGGLTVNLTSGNTSAVTVPANVSFAGNASSVSVAVTGVGPGTATISAAAPNVTGASATVTVTSGPDINIPSGLTLMPGEQLRFQITLAQPAPSGGVFVSLASSDSSKVTISPANIFIPQGLTSSSTQPQLTGVAAGSASISASGSGLIGDTEVVLVGLAQSFVPANLTIAGSGVTQSLSLTLSSAAPTGGLVFNLSSSNPGVATVPASVSVAANTSGVAVPVTSVAPGTTVIHSTSLAGFAETTANVVVVSAGSIILPAGVSVSPGQTLSFPVSIPTPAAAGGVTVSLGSSDPSKVTISPTSVFIAAGASTPGTQPQITGVALGSATISGSASGYGPASQIVQVNGALTFSPPSLTINSPAVQTLTLMLSVSAPAGLMVSLNSSNPAFATVPPSVMVAPGASSVGVQVTPVATGTTTITASAANFTNGVAGVTVALGGVNGNITLPTGVKIGPNQPAPFPVTLSVPAPAAGVTVSLLSSDPAVTVTPSVFITGGAVTPAAQPQIIGTAFATATITATAPGYNPASQSVQIGAALSFAPNSLTLSGPQTQNVQLNLSSPAPAGGLVVNLVSSNSALVTAPATVTFAAASSGVSVPVTGLAAGTATITASGAAPNISSATVTVVVTSTPDIILPSGLSLLPGQTLQFPLVLANLAGPGGAFVVLSSSDTSKLTVSPSSLIVPGGTTTSPVPVRITGVDFGTATLSASASGLTGDSESVLVGTAVGFSPQSLTIGGSGTIANLVLNLAAPAPAGGLTVALSSTDMTVASVPAHVTVPAFVSSVTVPVTSVGTGVAIIHASAPPLLPDTTATVNVVTSAMIGLPANVSVPLGQTILFPVTLGTSAPAGGAFVTLTSSDPVRIVVSPAQVFIAQGANTPAVQPTLSAFNTGTVTIGASAPGYISATQHVNATATVTFSPLAITANSGAVVRVLLSLSSAAPPGTTGAGRCEAPDPSQCSVTVALTSDNQNVAQIQPSVSFFPDGSSQAINQIQISAVGPGTTVIHAGAPPYIPDATIIVTVQ